MKYLTWMLLTLSPWPPDTPITTRANTMCVALLMCLYNSLPAVMTTSYNHNYIRRESCNLEICSHLGIVAVTSIWFILSMPVLRLSDWAWPILLQYPCPIPHPCIYVWNLPIPLVLKFVFITSTLTFFCVAQARWSREETAKEVHVMRKFMWRSRCEEGLEKIPNPLFEQGRT